ncbi:MAG TPA: gamma-glutamyl-gamma-aminobutyrate hydrolase family protein [Blastocatellia bacterium]|nr:gamma-glutamyl-gamma-aminobutyrate hydrolase family protein [Blastocatellia bacterium]
MKRPLIGIPCRYNWDTCYYELRETYTEALYAAGASPLLIPLIPEAGYIDSVIEHLDALCLSGAANDVDPLRYGREPKPECGPVVPRRDETDMLLLQAAEARNMPVLAICFGIQSLNVFRGGTLVQDVQSEVDGALKHMQKGEFKRHSHSINISEGSLLSKVAGGAHSARVNSHHHQAVDIVGRDLVPVAWASDGVVEAIANTRPEQFILGVQWHPEVGWESDPLSQAIFRHFVSVASHSAATQHSGEGLGVPAFQAHQS